MNFTAAKQKLKSKIAALQRDLETLERIEAEYGGTAPTNTVTKSAPKVEPGTDGVRLSLISMGKQAIESFPDGAVFTKSDVVKTIQELFPNVIPNEASVSSLLWNLAERGTLEIYQKGIGKTASRYRIPAVSASNGHTSTASNDVNDY